MCVFSSNTHHQRKCATCVLPSDNFCRSFMWIIHWIILWHSAFMWIVCSCGNYSLHGLVHPLGHSLFSCGSFRSCAIHSLGHILCARCFARVICLYGSHSLVQSLHFFVGCLCVHCFALHWLYVGIALPSFFVRESFMWVGFEVGTLLGS